MKGKFFCILYKAYKIRISTTRKIISKLILKYDGGQLNSKWIRKVYKDYHLIEIGQGSYGGCFNYEFIPPYTKIGKYCSIARNIYIFNANHPKSFITTHPYLYNPALEGVSNEKIVRNKLEIGNDVWIGQNVIILSSVNKIGDGAIIGAGAVVTKDVSPYSIVAGVPAKVIGYRFKKAEIECLEKIKWWDWDFSYIMKNKEYMYDINKFLNNFCEEPDK